MAPCYAKRAKIHVASGNITQPIPITDDLSCTILGRNGQLMSN